MPTPALWLISRCINFGPSVLFNVEDIYIVKDGRRFTSADHAKVRIVYFSSGMPGSRSGGTLTLDGGHYPSTSCNIEHEHIVEELVEVASAEHVKTALCPTSGEVHQ